jgi:hypothetical protein
VIRRSASFHLWIAAALAAIVFCLGLTWNTRVAAGSDAYGYVSQADLWLRGDLHIDQSFGANVPWPFARWTFTPLGYRPEPDGYRIVPQYSPGLPLLMAGFKAVAGQCAIFFVVPVCGGLLVLATYAIGRNIGRPLVGVAAAWLVATSATVLFMLMAPMSDVPAAAAWAVAIACALGQTRSSATASGSAAAVAILIRPNLAPLAAVIMLWMIWQDLKGPARRPAPTSGPAPRVWRGASAFAEATADRRSLGGGWSALRAAWFAIPAAAGAVAVAAINARLYGSPLASGYDLTDGFMLSYVVPNIRRYVGWLISAETPFALAGFAALLIPASRIWRTRESRDALPLLAAAAAVVWISYLLFVPWDAWWYLRYLLPAWPMMALGTASLAAMAFRLPSAGTRAGVIVLLAAIGACTAWQAVRRDTFDVARGESKYVEVARTVESLTRPDDVIVAAQHSGSIRYYGGRLTLRWDVGDPAWLDRTVEWLAAHGHHPYFVLEPQEIAELRERYGPANVSARLDWAPMVSFRGGAVTMYDAVRREREGPTVSLPARTSFGCLPQRPAPGLRTP